MEVVVVVVVVVVGAGRRGFDGDVVRRTMDEGG